MNMNREIVLEDGQEYYGYAFGSLTNRVCEIVLILLWLDIKKFCRIHPIPIRRL